MCVHGHLFAQMSRHFILTTKLLMSTGDKEFEDIPEMQIGSFAN